MIAAHHRTLALLCAAGLAAACDGAENVLGPAVLQLTITPAAVALAPGDTQDFDVTALLSDGSTDSTPTVTWSATGGTITAGGTFVAGVGAGAFQVIAAEPGGLADTVAVTVTGGGGRTYSTTFPLTEDPISEGGLWINGGADGLDWTNVSTTPGLAIGHQVGARYTDATALLTGTWGPDQMATGTVYSVNPKDQCFQEVEMRLRSAIGPHVNTGYEIYFKVSVTAQAYVVIARWNGPLGNFTELFRARGAQYGVATGDVVSAKIVGSVITAYKNGVQVGQATDTTFTGGSPGMGFNLVNAAPGCPGTNPDYGLTSFTASDGATVTLAAGVTP